MNHENTLGKSVSCAGIGTHSGNPAVLSICPAPAGYGVKFVRVDAASHEIPALWNKVSNTSMCTCITHSGVCVKTVEHVCAALLGMGVDNVKIELNNEEVPILDGSALEFARMIESAGITPQSKARRVIKILETVTIQDDDCIVSLEPSEKDTLSLEVELDLSAAGLDKQYISLDLTRDAFVKELALARTFGLFKDVQILRDKGLIKGSSLDNAIVIDNGKIMNPEGLRFENEMVRHKALDAVGDLSLAGKLILGKFYGKNCGHTLNQDLLQKLLNTPSAWEIC
ncbi:MAG: UDP-3-O-acyl-N-acetylglucosamine deacetylase [Holosporales bacterium]|jgi:UDP-3-O-[3-hydroxymyristoyl] N-acetylglucosamine deacetylase|nr:UDP-3-O-acyl-N-acetylglucosamine deacetylase [Holosporales bacterium]